MLTRLREALRAVLDSAETSRPPALRRALTDEALFAADLPRCASPEETARCVRLLESMGWRAAERDGWLLLDCPLPPLPVPLDAPEAAACADLLHRHPASRPDPVWARRLYKAAEAGKLEDACRELHRELAVRLRRREPLPGGLLAPCASPDACANPVTIRSEEAEP